MILKFDFKYYKLVEKIFIKYLNFNINIFMKLLLNFPSEHDICSKEKERNRLESFKYVTGSKMLNYIYNLMYIFLLLYFTLGRNHFSFPYEP